MKTPNYWNNFKAHNGLRIDKLGFFNNLDFGDLYMHSEDFIRVIKKIVREPAISSSIRVLTHPPGRKPLKEMVNLSEWFNRLPVSDREMLKKALELAVDSSIFGLLAILDGVRAVENTTTKGSFELYYTNGSTRSLLNNQKDEYLHDIYQRLK